MKFFFFFIFFCYKNINNFFIQFFIIYLIFHTKENLLDNELLDYL